MKDSQVDYRFHFGWHVKKYKISREEQTQIKIGLIHTEQTPQMEKNKVNSVFHDIARLWCLLNHERSLNIIYFTGSKTDYSF
jgi:hypothetical protein